MKEDTTIHIDHLEARPPITLTVETGNVDIDDKLDAAFGPADEQTQALIRRSIELHEIAAAMVVADSEPLVGRAVI